MYLRYLVALNLISLEIQNIIMKMWARPNGHHFEEDVLKCIFVKQKVCIFINI